MNAQIWNHLLAQGIARALGYQELQNLDGQCLIFKDPAYLNQVTGNTLPVFLQSQVPSLTFWKTCSSLS